MKFKKKLTKKNFGIISHPDAGKTTLTEVLLLEVPFKQLEQLRTIKLKKQLLNFMSEKQRGISVFSIYGIQLRQ